MSIVRLKAHIKEVHPDVEEETLLHDSVAQSFCLLEPGSDIQQEALGDMEMNAQEDLNAPSALDPQMPLRETVLDHPQNLKPHNEDLPSEKTSELHFSGSEQANHFTDCTIEKLADSSSISKGVSSDELLHCLTEKENNHLYANLGDVQRGDNVLGAVGHVTAQSSHLRDGEFGALAKDVRFDQSVCGENTGESVGNEIHHQIPGQNPASGISGGDGAFMAILNGLHKKQLNMDLLQKIRKVYGELECEYCGKEISTFCC